MRLRRTGLKKVPLYFAACWMAALSCISMSQQKTGDYGEAFRPQVHFSPQRNWTNDPNGLVYFKGEYHLFFQYNPFGDEWGHMSWGHAVSPDLLHWKELPVAIPEGPGEMIFTGSVVVDEKNTSGLCTGGKACMVAIYTGNRGADATQQEVQDLAASQDNGRTWQKYAGNPVLDLHMANFRDPNVSWNDDSHSWVMAVALPDEHKVAFYKSPDLKHWTQQSTFGPAGATGGAWECPDLLRVPDRGGKGAIWALKVGVNPGALQGGSGEQYFLGSFDGKTFTQSEQPGSHGWSDYGKDSYCAISYNHLPAGDRPVLLGWMDNWQYASKQPTSPWRGQMTLARRVTMIHDQSGLALAQEPVVAPLRILPGTRIEKQLSGQETATALANQISPLEMQLTFIPGKSRQFGLKIYSDSEHWTTVAFDLDKAVFSVDRTHSGQEIALEFPARTEAPLAKGRPFDLHVVLDRSSVSAFAQGGTIAMTNLIFPPNPDLRVVVFDGGQAKDLRVTGEAWRLRSIWAQRRATGAER
jgi:sucrose-6-phosphate hydrolase SacC (GH32 family)